MSSACELIKYQIQNKRMWEEASWKSSQTLLWNIPRSHFLDGQSAVIKWRVSRTVSWVREALLYSGESCFLIFVINWPPARVEGKKLSIDESTDMYLYFNTFTTTVISCNVIRSLFLSLSASHNLRKIGEQEYYTKLW